MKIFYSLCLIIFWTTSIRSIECRWHGGFLKASQMGDLVAIAKVNTNYLAKKKWDSCEIEFDVLKVLKGSNSSDKIILYDKDFIGIPLEFLKSNPFWVMSMYKYPKENYFEVFEDCGEYRLRLEKDTVKGFITNNSNCSHTPIIEMHIDSLIKMVKNPEKYMEPRKKCDDDVYIDLEEMPQLAKSGKEIYNYLSDGIKLPKEKSKFGKACENLVDFIFPHIGRTRKSVSYGFKVIVEVDGYVSVIQPFFDYSEDVAISLQKKIREIQFIPGKHHGKLYRSEIKMKINFTKKYIELYKVERFGQIIKYEFDSS